MNIGSNEELGKNQSNSADLERCIEVPCGWSRCCENNSVVYFSPNKTCLKSKEDIALYLISDKTCKCGLECPLYIDKVFNFDPSVSSCSSKSKTRDDDCHKTLCKETIKARFAATLTQTSSVKKNDLKGALPKAVVTRKKPERSVLKEGPSKLPSFDTFATSAGEKHVDNVQEQSKPNKARRSGSHKRKANTNSTELSTSSVPNISEHLTNLPRCRSVHVTTTGSIVLNSVTKTTLLHPTQYPSASTRTVFSSPDQGFHGMSQTAPSLLTFPSSDLNASSFLASLSSTSSNMLSWTPSSCGAQTNRQHNVHSLYSVPLKSSVDSTLSDQKLVTSNIPVATSHASNVVYLSSGLHAIPNHNPTASWSGNPGIPLSRLPHSKENAEKTAQEKSNGGFTMNTKGTSPPALFPFSTSVSTTKPLMSCSSSLPIFTTLKMQVKQPGLLQSAPNTQTIMPVKTTSGVKSESAARTPLYPASVMASTDKGNPRPDASATGKGNETANQALQYCGILLQPGMVPQVQLASAGARTSNLSAVNIHGIEPSQYGNLYTLQGIPYASNFGAVGSSALLGMPPNTVIPYFLGITQSATTPKPTVPTATLTSTTKESSPTRSASTPASTAAIAAACSAFVSIAPASVTNCSYSQQLVNLVSNYNNSYWQQLLTHGSNSSALAYQLMQVNQCTGGRATVTTHTSKSTNVQHGSSNQSQSKQETATLYTSKSSVSSSSGKPKTGTKSPISVSVASSISSATGSCVGSSSPGSYTPCSESKTSADFGENGNAERRTTISSTSPSCRPSATPRSVCSSSEDVISSKNDLVEKKSEKFVEEFPCGAQSGNVATKGLEKSDEKQSMIEGVLESSTRSELASDTSNKVTLGISDAPTPENQSSPDKYDVHSETMITDKNWTSDDVSKMETDDAGTKSVENESTVDMSDSHENDEAISSCDGNNLTVDEADVSKCVEKADMTADSKQAEAQTKTDDSNTTAAHDQNGETTGIKSSDNALSVDVIHNGEVRGISDEVEVKETVTKSEHQASVCGPPQFAIGDVVWAQARGLPSWPGKIVDERDVGSGKADNGKKWVMWFGDHTFSQVEVEKLKTLSDGLKTLDDKNRKRKYRGKKARIGLEQAIGEALEELDQRDRLRSRQGPKAKKKRL